MSGNSEKQHLRVKVLYDFQYESREGQQVTIVKDEELVLLRKTNADWWHATRSSEDEAFYVPATYVVEMSDGCEDEGNKSKGKDVVDAAEKEKKFANRDFDSKERETLYTVREVEKTHRSESETSDDAGKMEQQNCKDEKRSHESFRSVIRKLSSNLNPSSTKQVKVAKVTKKNSLNSSDEIKALKVKNDNSTEGSAFTKCFGRDMKHSDICVQNSFQEELQNALVNRSHRNIIYSSKQDDRIEHKQNNIDRLMFHKAVSKSEKVTSQKSDKIQAKIENVPKEKESFKSVVQKVIEETKERTVYDGIPESNVGLIKKEFETRQRNRIKNEKTEEDLKQNIPKNETNITANKKDVEVKRHSYLNNESVMESIKQNSLKTDQVISKSETGHISESNKMKNQENINQHTAEVDSLKKNENEERRQKSETFTAQKKLSENVEQSDITSDCSQQKGSEEKIPKQDVSAVTKMASFQNKDDDSILYDERKMWAIERLMSELMQKSEKNSSSPASQKDEEKGADKLAQELHDMNVTRNNGTKEMKVMLARPRTVEKKAKAEIFDFSKSPNVVLPKTVAKKSPKVLDEYNEANILNDNHNAESALPNNKLLPEHKKVSNYEKPSYCSVSLNSRKDKSCQNLKIEPKDYREELQLTPSLEKLASEIQFLPANKTPTDIVKLMYKECSKSDSALNREFKKENEPTSINAGSLDKRRANFVTKESANATRFVYPVTRDKNQHIIRKHSFAKPNMKILNIMKLKRKTRSLDNLNLPDEDILLEEKSLPMQNENDNKSKSNKPVPSLRTKDSFKKVATFVANDVLSNSVPKVPVIKPVPAKRRIIGSSTKMNMNDEEGRRKASDPALIGNSKKSVKNWGNFEVIDIERSTAVGFTTLLRTSDSGSEEYLQNKTIPSIDSKQFVDDRLRSTSNENMSKTSGNFDLNDISRSLSDEMILSSNASSMDLLNQLESEVNTTFDTSSSSSPFRTKDIASSMENLVELPSGWRQQFDQKTKQICFVNSRGDKWFSSNDSEGKIYFFEENSNESSWALPPVNKNDISLNARSTSHQSVTDDTKIPDTILDYLVTKMSTDRPTNVISHEMMKQSCNLQSSNWPQLFHGNMYILKEGVLNRTKITENGKKLKKSWSTSYAVLTELFLLFFKDAKTFTAMKMGQLTTAKPDISVDLNGASVESGDRFSSRKNVYIISTILGLQVLIQSDNILHAAEWYEEICETIKRLPSGQVHGKPLIREE